MPINRPESRLSKNPYVTSAMYYPQDLGSESSEGYMLIDIRNGVVNKDKSLGVVGLPLPIELQAKYSTQYQEVDLGIEKEMSFLGTVLGGGRGDLSAELAHLATKVTDTFTAANAQASAERKLGMIVNNHMAKLFKGVDFRSFSFNFHLSARSKKESDYIQNIIHKLKFHASADFDSQSIKRHILYPDNFIISLHSPSSNYLFKIGTCALSDLQVDYHGSGQASYFKNTGAPVDVRLSLTFVELELITKKKIEEGY